ncbi:hypothetical protein H6G00_15540 [Leptolyngbya sp. FACHB-541]|uniref:hypothetical protein n=1 Tax=Leptolyngbya sp. FACHB-541 TaxID=2692810 RepID=UPI001689F713|nr:hypothetical protein [Leptolyngbya sp. FACHB-541]MBD1998025.1 hypothetical protein [Leptolyngbya sp. FACHB-541]
MKSLAQVQSFDDLPKKDKGTFLDRVSKGIVATFMNKFGMEAGKDYVGGLSDNAECADFITISRKAGNLLKSTLKHKKKQNKKTKKKANSSEEFIQLELPFDDVA